MKSAAPLSRRHGAERARAALVRIPELVEIVVAAEISDGVDAGASDISLERIDGGPSLQSYGFHKQPGSAFAHFDGVLSVAEIDVIEIRVDADETRRLAQRNGPFDLSIASVDDIE